MSFQLGDINKNPTLKLYQCIPLYNVIYSIFNYNSRRNFYVKYSQQRQYLYKR